MLVLIDSLRQPEMTELLSVYARLQMDKKDFDASDFAQIRQAEAEAYDFYLDFFGQRDSFCAVWSAGGSYRSILHIQRYMDAALLTGLETLPEDRGKGYATQLVMQTVSGLQQRGFTKLYSHVAMDNAASLRVHAKCGFYKHSDCARLLDGTVTAAMYTLCKDI